MLARVFVWYFIFNLTLKVNINAQDTKLNPVTIISNRSGINIKTYRKAIALVNVQTIYEGIFALAVFFLYKSFIVGQYPAVAIIPVDAYVSISKFMNISFIVSLISL